MTSRVSIAPSGRSRATLVVLSESLGPAELVAALGPGDRVWAQGDATRPRSRSRQTFNGWSIESTIDRSKPPQAHVANILPRLERVASQIQTLQSGGSVSSVRLWLHLDKPDIGLALDQNTLRSIARVASLEVDIYG